LPTDKEFRGVEDIPEPFKVTRFKDIIGFLIGPAIISVSVGIGTGEVISGPLAILSYGPTILWFALLSIFLQTVSAIAGTRYTMATGEPLINGISRLWLGKKVWAIIWTVSDFVRLMWPYYMVLTGTTFAYIALGRPPEAPEQYLVGVLGVVGLLIGIAPLLFGEKIEKTLGWLSWWDVVVEVGIIIIITLLVVPLDKLFEVFAGFFAFGSLPKGVNWAIIAAIAGYAGNYAANAIAMTNYYRDTEWGMTKKTGFIPAVVGGKAVPFLSKGYLPKTDPENVRRYKGWMKYVHLEQWIVFFFGSLITMWFPVALAYHLVPGGAKLPSGWAFPVALANYMPIPALVVLMTILLLALYITNTVTVVDMLPREFTNIWWTAFPSLEKKFKGDAKKLYYTILAVLSVIWVILMFVGVQPAWQAVLAGAFANLIGVFCYIGLLGVNYVLLPKEYRMKWWEIIVILVGLVFYSIIFVAFVLNNFFGIKI